MNTTGWIGSILLCALIAHPSAAAEPLSREVVLARLIASYGGVDNLRKLDAMEQLWRLRTHVGRGDGHDYRRILLPDHLLVELTYPDHTERRLLTDHGAYNAVGDAPLREANVNQGHAMRLQSMRIYSPLTLSAHAADLEFRDDLDVCALSLRRGTLRADYLVDKRTWRIEKVVGTLQINGMEMQFLTEYADFRMVDGVLLHHRENKYAGAVNTATLELLRVDLDADLDEEDFALHRPHPGN